MPIAQCMTFPESISRPIIEALYCEALVLSDEVRAAFQPIATEQQADHSASVSLALTCEGLSTTTRMMRAIAWLLNHRAYLAGELSETQLRRQGKLHDCPASDPERVALRELIAATEQFHARLMRLDQSWRSEDCAAPSGLAILRQRLGVPAG